ncbi:MAG: GNAT family N-acetyltransferase [Smithella sp.]|jgi:acyl-CoA hydrolase/GNAT superfamily N-acetyltransferase|nr:GNAT family N-acetyltransferase [Smithella sp.]
MWKNKIVSPKEVLSQIEPGMSIFLGTGMAEPRTLVKHLMNSDTPNLQDMELIQLVSLGDTIPIDERYSRKFRLKTFVSGWLASEAISAGRVDLIPSRFSRISSLFKSGAIHIDATFIQISPPDENGYASLVGVDVEKQAMEAASLVVGEINQHAPRTLGDTLVHMDEFNYLVESTESPLYIPRWPVQDIFLKIAANIANVIKDGSCISFGIGYLYEALAVKLAGKKNLGIHSPFFTDALMDLVKSGAITNRNKRIFRNKCAAAYLLGSEELMRWLDCNPLVEFQPIDVITDPKVIGSNDRMIAILPARKIDLTGNVALHTGKGNITAGPGNVQELFIGASLSKKGRTIFGLPSRDLKGLPNILLSVDNLPFQFTNRESMDMVATEYGVAYLMGKTIRESAQELIDIAHPDDRNELVKQAKEAKVLYTDQIYFPESGHLYPAGLCFSHKFKSGLKVNFRPIKPSDEEKMRDLFYRFSDKAVYSRYFTSIKTMPHKKTQEYVNVDYRMVMSIVGIVGVAGSEKIIAEARYVRTKQDGYADTAFIVDEKYQNKGIASYLFELLIRVAREEGVKGFTADVLATNDEMLRVFKKSPFPVKIVLSTGIYELTIPFKTT